MPRFVPKWSLNATLKADFSLIWADCKFDRSFAANMMDDIYPGLHMFPMVNEVNKWNQHRWRSAPSNHPGTRDIISLQKILLGDMPKDGLMLAKHSRVNLKPFLFYLDLVLMRWLLKDWVAQWFDFGVGPTVQQIRFGHNLEERMPEGFSALAALVDQEDR